MSRAVGIVDVGSNTVRLAVYVANASGSYRLAAERRAVLRLGAYGPELGAKAYRRTAAVLTRFRNVARSLGAAEMVAAATAAVRAAVDGEAFARRLREETGVPLRIIDGREEAQLGLLGVVSTLSVADGVLADVGGASTEVTLFRDRRLVASSTLPAGAVNLTTGWLPSDPPTAEHLARLREHVASLLAGVDWLGEPAQPVLVGVGGTFRALARLARRRLGARPRSPLHGSEVPPGLPAVLLGELAAVSSAKRAAKPGIAKHRADVIVAGLAVIGELVARSRAPRVVVSGHGLRDGLFLRWLHGDDHVVDDIAAESLDGFLDRFGIPRQRAERVSGLACDLFDALRGVHHLDPEDRGPLRVGAMLREAGAFLDAYKRAKHTFYLVRWAPLFGLGPRERLMAAAAASYDGLEGHRERWIAAQGNPEELTSSARLGFMVALADALADICPEGDVELRASASSGRIAVQVGGCAGSLPDMADMPELDALIKDFRRIFGGTLTLRFRG